MKVLFIGGTGIISSACSVLAIRKGIELYHLNRGLSSEIRNVDGVKNLNADIRDKKQVWEAIRNLDFDVVVDWIAFVPSHIEQDIELFKNKTGQYIFISSASVYQTPPQQLPVTEQTPLENPVWVYSQNKIACENTLKQAWKTDKFPFTIVRPSHTYDKTLLPIEGGYTVIDRMLKGKPIIVHGDGTSIWTLTHSFDFAKGLVGLLGKNQAIAEDFHITSDQWLSWNQIYIQLGKSWGVRPNIINIPSNIIAQYNKEIGDSLMGDKAHSMIFDNSKIKNIVPDFICSIPFENGCDEIAEWYKSDRNRQITDVRLDCMFDEMISDYKIYTTGI